MTAATYLRGLLGTLPTPARPCDGRLFRVTDTQFEPCPAPASHVVYLRCEACAARLSRHTCGACLRWCRRGRMEHQDCTGSLTLVYAESLT